MRVPYLVAGFLVALVVAQLIPLDRGNPPVARDVGAPAAVQTVLRRACYDCHSHETVWPWYAWVAPVSWLVVHDVEEGREELNFSTWDQHSSAPKFGELLDEIVETVEEGGMPPWYYLPLHPQAELSAAESSALVGWAAGLAAGVPHLRDQDRDSDSDH